MNTNYIGALADHFGLLGAAAMAFFAAYRIFLSSKRQKAARCIIEDAIKSKMNEPLTLHPEIDPAICMGCGACTRVCPEGDVLALVANKAKLVSPTLCVGHGECERVCPVGAISLVFGTKTRGMDIPRLTTNYETNVGGLYIAGELGGMGLIRNAIKQGALAGKHAIKTLKPVTGADYDLIIVGAGPAGLAAALVAIASGRRYLLIEQNSFGGTVANFPRQKVVMSHPAEIPMFGKMKFPGNKVSKEELIGYWERIRRKTGMKMKENTKFEGLRREKHHFTVKTNDGTFTAQKVLLCMGVRGSPRKLGLANEDLPKVTYNLIDPEQYRKKSVAVVGGGNAGVEAAQMLAEAKYGNKVVLLVRGSDFDRCNEENRKIIKAMEKKGLVQIWFDSIVQKIDGDTLTVKKQGEDITIPNDYLFVFAGAEMPHKFLMSLGVQIDKKFGEALGAKA